MTTTWMAVDADTGEETGIVLLALDTGRLLVGLGAAAMLSSVSELAILVEEAEHTGVLGRPYDSLLTHGAHMWTSMRKALDNCGVFALKRPGDPRGAWRRLHPAVDPALPGAARSTVALATACVYRREQVDDHSRRAMNGYR